MVLTLVIPPQICITLVMAVSITFVMNTPPQDPTSPAAALEAAIALADGPVALARKLDVPLSLPSMWRSRGRVPADYCPAIERVTEGKVRCEDLRPDVEWSVLRVPGVATRLSEPEGGGCMVNRVGDQGSAYRAAPWGES
jgi:DNA-binding transcriptional regulator YdaS (Cro superfamily)